MKKFVLCMILACVGFVGCSSDEGSSSSSGAGSTPAKTGTDKAGSAPATPPAGSGSGS